MFVGSQARVLDNVLVRSRVCWIMLLSLRCCLSELVSGQSNESAVMSVLRYGIPQMGASRNCLLVGSQAHVLVNAIIAVALPC